MHLFSPLTIGHVQLANRVAWAAQPSGFADADGALNREMATFYHHLAQGGTSLIVFEAAWPLPPPVAGLPHLGLYDDSCVAALGDCISAIKHAGSCAIVMLDQPVAIDALSDTELGALARAWLGAASRAYHAGADGIMLSCADGGPFHQLLSPLLNGREDAFGGSLHNRTQLLLALIDRLHSRYHGRMLLGLRLLVEEFAPGGLTLQDARVVARRMTGAGVDLLEAYAKAVPPVAQFPGWRVPLAAALRTLTDVPIMVGDLLADAEFADATLRERGADLVAMNEALRADSTWPRSAREALRTA